MSEGEAAWAAFKASVAELEGVLAAAPSVAPEQRQEQLMLALSRLEIACILLPNVAPDSDGDEASPNTHDQRRAQVCAAFPEFGYYNHADARLVDPEAETTLGDAVNDLADILRDIDDALFCDRKAGWRDGVWQAKFNYETHAGAHLVDLRAYLYRLRYTGP